MATLFIDHEVGKGPGYVAYEDENGDLVLHIDMDSRVGESNSGKTDKIAVERWCKPDMSSGADIGFNLGVYIKKPKKEKVDAEE